MMTNNEATSRRNKAQPESHRSSLPLPRSYEYHHNPPLLPSTSTMYYTDLRPIRNQAPLWLPLCPRRGWEIQNHSQRDGPLDLQAKRPVRQLRQSLRATVCSTVRCRTLVKGVVTAKYVCPYVAAFFRFFLKNFTQKNAPIFSDSRWGVRTFSFAGACVSLGRFGLAHKSMYI